MPDDAASRAGTITVVTGIRATRKTLEIERATITLPAGAKIEPAPPAVVMLPEPPAAETRFT
jgi:hypothetical protein